MAQHAPTPAPGPMDPTLQELPPLVCKDGLPTQVEKMTCEQLRWLIPRMIKHSTGRKRPRWGKESKRPPWWPQDLPWKNVKSDPRTADEKQKVSWTHVLGQIVINCYKYHGQEDLLPVFSGDHEDADIQPQIYKFGKASPRKSLFTFSAIKNPKPRVDKDDRKGKRNKKSKTAGKKRPRSDTMEEIEVRVKEESTDTKNQGQGQVHITPDWKLHPNVECRVRLERLQNAPSETLPSMESCVSRRTFRGQQIEVETNARSEHDDELVGDALRTLIPSIDEVEESHVTSGRESGSEWLERGDHPLLNDVILDNLFGFVRRFDLKACRVVSKTWNRRTLPHVRASFKVKILGNQSTDKTEEDPRRIHNFVQLFSSNELGMPFSRFILGSFRTTEGVGQQFLRLCGETATEIDLDMKLEDYTVEDVSELLRSCPKIQVIAMPERLISRSRNIVKLFQGFIPTFRRLKKITFYPDYKRLAKCCPTSVQELLTAGPNLTDISVSNMVERDYEGIVIGEVGVSEIALALNCVEKLGKESSIQNLFLHNSTTKDIEILERMAKNGLQLKTLTLDPSLPADDGHSVHIRLATCFKESLESLVVIEEVDSFLMDFPKMPRLKSLTQRIIRHFDTDVVNLNENFPALETLEIQLEDAEEEEELGLQLFFSGFNPCPNLKSLAIQGVNLKICLFRNFSTIFPNLTKLTFQVHHEDIQIFRQLWAHMTQLESLSIRGYMDRTKKDYFDSLFTGISTGTLKSIRYVLNDLKEMTVQMRKETILNLVRKYCHAASIRKLKKLKHLHLEMKGEFHLTDFTAYLSFYLMDQLSDLVMYYCDFTNTCCEILVRETGLETWMFRNRILGNIIPKFTYR